MAKLSLDFHSIEQADEAAATGAAVNTKLANGPPTAAVGEDTPKTDPNGSQCHQQVTKIRSKNPSLGYSPSGAHKSGRSDAQYLLTTFSLLHRWDSHWHGHWLALALALRYGAVFSTQARGMALR